VVFTRIAPAYAEIIKALRIAVLIKQVPLVETLSLGPDGRLLRHGMDLEINAYCRRAISQGVELARQTGGRATVFTLGPPAAEDALREAVAWGADDGVLITDPAFAGSDTLATARALAAAIERHGPFDLILAGRNSVDADTGQVGPEVAELLDLPFLAGVRAMTLKSETVVARLELDDGWADAEVDLPALLTTAERLCPPAKVDRPGRAAVDPARLHRLTAADLGPGPWGEAGSPTRVGGVRALEVARRRLVLSGPPPDQVAEAVALLRDAGALDQLTGPHHPRPEGIVADGWLRGEKGVGVLLVMIAVFGSLIAQDVVSHFLDHRYSQAGSLIPWIIAGYLFHSIYGILQPSLLQARRVGFLWVVSGAALVANIGLNFFWIPRSGMYGAAYATTVAYLIEAALMYFYAQRVYPLEFSKIRLAAALAIFGGALWVTQVHWQGWRLLVFGLTLLGSVAVIVAMGRKEFTSLLGSMRRRS
jgi:electron transfer flavoprotein alpha/beta subunit